MLENTDQDQRVLKYRKTETKPLRDLGFDERWLQERILEDPSILGLGELSVIERERVQPTGGRLDFLMYDPEENGVRFEIEVMLGKLDESHIIRTIEYWDIERRRFPSLEHRAVIVSEEITNRFFNVISLLNGAVPIIALQLSALQVDNSVILSFTKVIDIPEPDIEGEDGPVQRTDRAYWESYSNPQAIGVVDKMVSMISSPDGAARVTYNKSQIAAGTSGRHFLWFNPRKISPRCHIVLRLDEEVRDKIAERFDEVGVFAGSQGKYMKLRINQKELDEHEELVRELLKACEEYSRS